MLLLLMPHDDGDNKLHSGRVNGGEMNGVAVLQVRVLLALIETGIMK
jgi:hypothetical protein